MSKFFQIIGSPFRKLFLIYYHGFRDSSTARTLLLLVAIKLFVMFVVLKLFFFPDFLKSRFDTDKERSEYVLDKLTQDNNK